MTADRSIWIRTQPSLDGRTYVATVDFSDDESLTLTPDGAVEYAKAILAYCHRAEYDSAILTQVRKMGLDDIDAVNFGIELRKDRPEIPRDATGPLRIEPGVTMGAKPFLKLIMHGEEIGQWEIPQAREHALMAIEASQVADLDAHYYRNLIGSVGLEEDVARATIDGLRDCRYEHARP